MKNLKKAFSIILFIFPLIIFSQTIIPAGDVTGIWTKQNSPYLIEGEITIPDGLQLTVEPGVLVEFQGHFKFIVKGTLLAMGELNDTITFTINDTTGFHNMSIPDGGWHGLRFSYYDDPDTSFVRYCKFDYGKAVGEGYNEKYGGAIHSNAKHLVISHCRFQNNSATYLGGAIKISSNNFFIDNCHITNNIGGGINIIGSFNGFISNCFIANNSGYGISGDGFTSRIINNVISDNTSGGIYFSDTFGAIITNNTICYNTSNFEAGGISISFNSNDMLFNNNIIYGNTSNEGNQISIKNVYINHYYFYNNNIEGGKEKIIGNNYIAEYENNIDTDPFFNITGPHEYNLQAISPCINAGTLDTTGLFLPLLDILGNPRFYNNSIIDMGAYEFQGEPVLLPEIGFIYSSFDFGAVNQNKNSKDYPLLISNYGNALLEINIISPNDFWIKPAGSTIFVQEIPNLTINPKNDTIIQVIFLPTDTLKHIDSLLVLSNDMDDPTKFISLTGTGTNEFILEGIISTDSTICENKILVNGDVYIEPESKLTICAGTEVEFLNNYVISVSGILEATGETEDSISFRLTNDSLFFYNSIPEYWGGLIFMDNNSDDSSKLSHCIIENTHNLLNGAICINDYSNINILNCNIRNNNYNAQPKEDSVFGISCFNSSPLIKNSIIKNSGKGGISCVNYSSPSIVNNTIINNVGYGIYCKSYCNPIILNNKISSNTKSGIYITSATSIIISNEISNNSFAGIFFYDCFFSSIISNNLIYGNTSNYNHGGISFYANDGSMIVNNNTIVQNSPSGIAIFDSSPLFQNNIVEGNYYQVSLTGNYSNSDFYYCNIEGGFESFNIGIYATYTGNYENNIDADPLFIYTGEHPYMLQASSPCIDMGTPDTTNMNLPVLDFAGNPRIYNDRIDIGVYEYGLYPPLFTSEPVTTATVNELYSYLVSASDLTGNPLIFDYNLLPDWINFSASDTNYTLLTGIPQIENMGDNPVELTVSNSLFETSQSFIITVTEVGIKDDNENLMSIYPNPSTGKLWIKLPSNHQETATIEIFNSYGEQLKILKSDQILIPVDLSGSPKGIYLLRIKSGSENFTQKILIQ